MNMTICADNLDDAAALQLILARKVRLQPLPEDISFLASAWVDFESPDPKTIATACAVLCEWPSLRLLHFTRVKMEVNFPYISGLFAFRAGTPLLASLKALERRPDVLLLNAQGIAHVRRCGMASHIGILTGIPTVGCTRQRPPFPVGEPGEQRGAMQLFGKGGEILGAAVRVCEGVRPLYVSPGHLADIDSCVRLVLHCCRGFRLPEPLRMARERTKG